jgi:hypothetical protein
MTIPKVFFEDIVRSSHKKENRLRTSKRNRLALWIGRVVITFNELECRIADCVAKSLSQSDKEISDMLLASMSYTQKLDLLSALLAKQHSGNASHLDFCQSLLQGLSKAEEFRNALVHSHWPSSFFGGDFLRRKPKTKGRKGLKIFERIADVDSICDGLKEIEALGVLILGFTNPRFAMRFDTERIRASHQVFDKVLNEVSAKATVPTPHYVFWGATS